MNVHYLLGLIALVRKIELKCDLIQLVGYRTLTETLILHFNPDIAQLHTSTQTLLPI